MAVMAVADLLACARVYKVWKDGEGNFKLDDVMGSGRIGRDDHTCLTFSNSNFR